MTRLRARSLAGLVHQPQHLPQPVRRRLPEQVAALLDTSVFLELTVAVLEYWSRNLRHLAELGYPEE